jgi:hypothetical protein
MFFYFLYKEISVSSKNQRTFSVVFCILGLYNVYICRAFDTNIVFSDIFKSKIGAESKYFSIKNCLPVFFRYICTAIQTKLLL